MPYGMISCVLGVFFGGLLGKAIKKWIDEGIRNLIPLLLGLTAMCNGVLSVVRVHQMPVVTFSVLLGGLIGHALHLEERVEKSLSAVLEKIPHPDDFDMERYVTVTAIFCASGFGLYAVMVESFCGERTQMFSKAILDMFCAVIFGSSMGIAISMIAIPQLLIFSAVFLLAKVLMPIMTEDMLMNFVACGGVLTIAAGMRMAKIKEYPLIDMLPGLVLVLLLTPLWTVIFP